MRVPDHGLLRHDGAQTTIYALAEERPLALVFLRHLGCLFCREQVATLRDALPDENIAFVTMAEPDRAERFRRWMRSPHEFYCDPERRLYHDFHVGRGALMGFVSPKIIRRALQTTRKGFWSAPPHEDPLQLGGTFVIDREGCVLASFPAADAGDHPSPEALRSVLRSANPTSA